MIAMLRVCIWIHGCFVWTLDGAVVSGFVVGSFWVIKGRFCIILRRSKHSGAL